jgi:hypothetical protein
LQIGLALGLGFVTENRTHRYWVVFYYACEICQCFHITRLDEMIPGMITHAGNSNFVFGLYDLKNLSTIKNSDPKGLFGRSVTRNCRKTLHELVFVCDENQNL